MEKKSIIVLDFEKGEVHIYDNYPDMEAEDFLRDRGFSPNNCQWMIIPTKDVTVNYHKH